MELKYGIISSFEMEQQLLLSCLALFVHKTDCISTGAEAHNAEAPNAEAHNTEETKLPF